MALRAALHNGYYENLGRGILMFATLSLGWNIIGGYAGYVSFGNVVYFGLGAYTSGGALAALGSERRGRDRARDVVGVLFALVLGIPILRLRGHYFGIATLGIALATQEIIANVDWLGGGSGFTLRQLGRSRTYYYAMWLVCAGACSRRISSRARNSATRSSRFAKTRKRRPCSASIRRAIKSSPGRSARRWRPPPARCSPFANGFIDPPTAFAVDNNVFPIVMAMLGGIGTVAGPLVGAFILTAINESLWSRFPQIHTLFFGARDRARRRLSAARHPVAPHRSLRGGWRGFVGSLGPPTAYERRGVSVDPKRQRCTSAGCRRSTTSRSTWRRVRSSV
jgi:branched-chain amino acid transport system permease protein